MRDELTEAELDRRLFRFLLLFFSGVLALLVVLMFALAWATAAEVTQSSVGVETRFHVGRAATGVNFGAGFVVSPGVAATARHVVAPPSVERALVLSRRVVAPGRDEEEVGDVLAESEAHDLALVRAPRGVPALPVGERVPLVQERVWFVPTQGAPREGVVTRVHLTIPGFSPGDLIEVLVPARVQLGDSGGALVDDAGRVVGVGDAIWLTDPGEGLPRGEESTWAYFVPAARVRDLMKSHPLPPLLGEFPR